MFGLDSRDLAPLVIAPLVIAWLLWKRPRAHVEHGARIGGWLLAIAVVVVTTPFSLAWTTYQAFAFSAWREMEPAEVAVAAGAIVVINGLLIVWSIYSIVLFLRQRRSFPWVWTTLNGALLLTAIVFPTTGTSLGIMIFWTALWSVYLFTSQRVKATFVE